MKGVLDYEIFAKSKKNKALLPILFGSLISIAIAFFLNFLYENSLQEDAHTITFMTYFSFFSYPLIPAFLGGILTTFISQKNSRRNILLNILILLIYFILILEQSLHSSGFLIAVIYLPLILIGYFIGGYTGLRFSQEKS